MRNRVIVAAVAAALLAADFVGADDANLPKGPCGSKPPAQEQRRKGGEGVPPLPLPATPLRRTERKRPPAPPSLVAKIQYGVIKEITRDDQVIKYWDWNENAGDIPVLLSIANPALNMHYTYKTGPLNAFPPDPAQYPIFYYTGSDSFELSDAEVERLRDFLRAGGTIWGDTCFGDPDFFKSFIQQMGKVLPDRHFRRLEPGHPLFNCYYPIQKVKYTRAVPDAPNGEPVFYGADLGCRTAIILSRYGLSCGWDGHIREGAMNVDPNDARRLGVNMIAYALATHPLAVSQSTTKVYYEEKERARGDFVFVQAKVGENWDSQANGIANLLKAVAAKTSTEVKFDRKTVQLTGDDLQRYPFLYLTGHYDFSLTEPEVQALRRYLQSGGFLLAGPCCGSREFDAAFRREIAKVLPSTPLQSLPSNHPVYNVVNDIRSVSYTKYVESLGESPPPLPLEGISLGGATPVVYCPYGLGGGWRGFDHPFGRDVASDDALKLGVNVVVYALTH